MTRPITQVREALALRATGLGARRIATRLGIPVPTVQGWLSDPERALARPAYSASEGCDGRCEPWVDIDAPNYAYLLGMYLGDGHIVRMGRVYRFSVYCDDRYPRIKDEVEAGIAIAMPRNVVSRAQQKGCTGIGSLSKHWACFFPQHGPGMKHERPIRLEDWQRLIVEEHPRPFIRGLLHSDGCRFTNVAVRRKPDGDVVRRHYPRYQFTNRSDDIRGLFCWALGLLDVHWTRANAVTISVARRDDVRFLDTFVGPKA